MIRKQEITTFDFPEDAIIWDVRECQSYQEGHLQGVSNQPISTIDMTILESTPEHTPIYVLCGGGSKAPRAAELLEELDSSREYVILMGGTRAAKAAGLPVVQGT